MSYLDIASLSTVYGLKLDQTKILENSMLMLLNLCLINSIFTGQQEVRLPLSLLDLLLMNNIGFGSMNGKSMEKILELVTLACLMEQVLALISQLKIFKFKDFSSLKLWDSTKNIKHKDVDWMNYLLLEVPWLQLLKSLIIV